MSEKWLGVDDVSETLGVPVASLRSGRLRRDLPWCKVGRFLKMRPESFERWANEAEQQPRRCRRTNER